jgi:hypothetical protein
MFARVTPPSTPSTTRPEQSIEVTGITGPTQIRRLNEATAARAMFEPEQFGPATAESDVTRLVFGPYETVRIDT